MNVDLSLVNVLLKKAGSPPLRPGRRKGWETSVQGKDSPCPARNRPDGVPATPRAAYIIRQEARA